MDLLSLEFLKKKRVECALQVLDLHRQAKSGHIGPSLSCLEILVDLGFYRSGSEDVILLSKGHAASALYSVLWKAGRLPGADLATYYKNGTRMGAHPPCSGFFKSIPFGTGSLGHGLSLATGMAFSQRFTGRSFQVFCILSDGDCNEGSTWEAALFASHHKLSNLTVIVDANGIQGFGLTSEVINLEPLEEKWKSFGFQTQMASDGNSFLDLDVAHLKLQTKQGDVDRPKCVVAKTLKGHGVSYMENKMEWHYLQMNEEQFQAAIKETNSSHA